MNLLLLDPSELDGTGRVTLQDRRAEHLLQILKVTLGASVRIGLIGGPLGQALVEEATAPTVRLRCTLDEAVPKVPQDVLLLGMPRPKVLARCLEHAASLGFGRIVVFRCRQTVKSHLDSHLMRAEQLQNHLLAGMEQARRTWLPQVSVFPRFRPFLEDHLESVATATNRYLADPDAAVALRQALPEASPMTLVIGPEGGLMPHELEGFSNHGFRIVHTGCHPLRVETALSFVAGQLVGLRGLREGSL